MTHLCTSGTDDAIRLLDSRGCLTAEAMCFVDELGPDQRAVVDRHVRACGICAQQQAGLSSAAQRVRQGRPRVTVPADARIAARQAVLRTLMLHRRRPSVEVVAPAEPEDSPHARRWRLVLCIGLSALMLVGAAALVFALV